MSDRNNDSPSYKYKSTPPPYNRKVRNPFDRALIDKLHKPICSPGMCKIYKKKHTGTFRWEIDQACTLVPADIVACNSQFEPSPDPALERIAEEATEKFFSQEMVMPSPLMETSKKVKPLLHTSCDAGIQITSFVKEESTVFAKDAQTVLTLPPELPPEIEKILQPFFTFTQDQDISGEYEITANGSLRRKLFFEEHSDMEHYDSEQTDDEIHVEPRPPSSFEAHTPVTFSPDLYAPPSRPHKMHAGMFYRAPPPYNTMQLNRNPLRHVFRLSTRHPQDESRDCIAKGMKRTFGTPLKKTQTANKPCYRNKILDVVDFGEACPFSPIEFRTPKRTDQESATSSSLASISPVNKISSSDEEKNNFTSPESEEMAKCLNCVNSETEGEKKEPCFCKTTPNKIILKRSKSLKESPPRSRKGSISEKRSLSMSSLHRSRSVQKLDFSMDMSIDGSHHNNSQADLDCSSAEDKDKSWSIIEETSIKHLVQVESAKIRTGEISSSNKLQSVPILDETPIKGKTKDSVRSHEISKIRIAMPLSPLEMSLDSSLDIDNPLSLEDKKIDFNTVDLNFLTENVSQFDYTAGNATKTGDDISSSFKRIDSGFNENTFYANASSYYECAIKPSELTVTNVSKTSSKNALKELTNVNWMRVDSGFKDETSTDSMQFYNASETQTKKFTSFQSEVKLDNKENTEDFGRFLVDSSNKHDTMSISEIFTDDMTFNCNFSSTPSKNKSRHVNS